MKRKEPISKIMTTDIIKVKISQKISVVHTIFEENPIHHIPVVKGRKLVGLISATDMMKLSFALSYSNKTMDSDSLDKIFSIEEVMQKELATINSSETIHRAAEMFCGGQFHSLPVVNEKNQLEGIVTSTDIIMYMLDQY